MLKLIIKIGNFLKKCYTADTHLKRISLIVGIIAALAATSYYHKQCSPQSSLYDSGEIQLYKDQEEFLFSKECKIVLKTIYYYPQRIRIHLYLADDLKQIDIDKDKRIHFNFRDKNYLLDLLEVSEYSAKIRVIQKT